MTDIEHPETFHGLPVFTLPRPGEDGPDLAALPDDADPWDPEDDDPRYVAVSE
ncbi:hypothetical protein [Streptomyces sp. A0642]|uniref:hypothetical protein n=1 Tax=Streptomyces sp. A0642 TaxID=2563100 RepID=UPI001445D298|nr:hypothetical protein [Streptomyces sp. A0642]